MLPAGMDRLRCDPPRGYVLQSRDSSYRAEKLQFEAWSSMTPAAKARAQRALGRRAWLLHLRGLRELHPGASERELVLRDAAQRLGADLVRRWTGFDASRS
jgi:hypothetical protein